MKDEGSKKKDSFFNFIAQKIKPKDTDFFDFTIELEEIDMFLSQMTQLTL